MAVHATYKLEMEFTTGTWTDVTDDLIGDINAQRGMRNYTDRIANIGQMSFALYNLDGSYSPDHASVTSGFGIGCACRFTATYSSTDYILFQGAIVDIMPTTGKLVPYTTVVCYDDMDKLARNTLRQFLLHENKTTDQIVSSVLGNTLLTGRLLDADSSPTGLWDDLLSYYPFYEESGTTAHDVYTLKDMTITGTGAGVAGISGTKALHLDGSDDRAYVDITDWSDEFTVSLWAVADTITQSASAAVFASTDALSTQSFQFDVGNNNAYRFLCLDDAKAAQSISTLASPVTTTIHMVATCDGTNGVTVYANGAVAGTIGSMTAGDFDVYKVGEDRGSAKYFDGTVDELCIWQRALTAAEVTTLYNLGAPIKLDFDTGRESWTRVGYAWQDEQTPGRQAVSDVIKSEWGTFYLSGDGTYTFHERRYRPGLSVGTTLNQAWSGVELSRSRADMANIIRTELTQVAIQATAVVWTAPLINSQYAAIIREGTPGPIFIAEYGNASDPALKRIGTDVVVVPVATTDFTANSAADGSGTDHTTDLILNMALGANSAWISVVLNPDNAPYGYPVYLTKLQLRAQGIFETDRLDIVSEDLASHDSYGPLELNIGIPIHTGDNWTVEDAQSFTDWLLYLLKDPFTSVRSITFIANISDAHMQAALIRDIDTRIALTDSQSGLSAEEFYIEGVEHHILASLRQHRTTWHLSAAERETMWFLGTAGKSELGQVTYLGF